MIRLELRQEEAQALAAILESVLSDLSYEIANTDQQNFREQLKARRDALMSVHNALTTVDKA